MMLKPGVQRIDTRSLRFGRRCEAHVALAACFLQMSGDAPAGDRVRLASRVDGRRLLTAGRTGACFVLEPAPVPPNLCFPARNTLVCSLNVQMHTRMKNPS